MNKKHIQTTLLTFAKKRISSKTIEKQASEALNFDDFFLNLRNEHSCPELPPKKFIKFELKPVNKHHSQTSQDSENFRDDVREVPAPVKESIVIIDQSQDSNFSQKCREFARPKKNRKLTKVSEFNSSF